MKENEYITHLRNLLPDVSYTIIDLNKCLIDFVSEHKSELVELFNLLQSATQEIFKAPAGEESQDMFKKLCLRSKILLMRIRFLSFVNTGSLYGTGMHNIHLMENDIVMKASLPLIILYPATIEPDQIMVSWEATVIKIPLYDYQ